VLGRVIAALTFDSWTTGAIASGMRGQESDTRHLLFNAMGRDIDLRITAAANHYSFTGQILGPDEAGVVEIVEQDATAGAAARIATLDDLGEFRLDDVPAGVYVLTFRLGADVVVVPPVRVGESEA
jgi:hypothetical protein